MLRYIPAKRLKDKLIICFLTIAIFPAATISCFYYKTSQTTLEKNMIRSAVNDMYYIGDMIDKQMKFAEQLSDWAFINPALDKILTKKWGEPLHYEAPIFEFQDLMDFQLRNTSVGTHVSSFLIIGKNQIDLRVGNESAQINITHIQETDWFRTQMGQNGKKCWFGLVANPAVINNEPYILPLVRPILHSNINREIGWQMIAFRTSIISELLKRYEISNDEILMVLDSRGVCIFHNRSGWVGKDLSYLKFFNTIADAQEGGYLNSVIDDKNRLVSYGKSQLTGWSIIKILSVQELTKQKKLLIRVTILILLFTFIFTLLLIFFLTTYLTHRLQRLLQRTKAIASGDFQRDYLIEGEDELGVLGYGINEMAVNIKHLLAQVIQKEREKRRLELDVLQNQVNPHFLYNTLNSLKLMATIQKSEGIREMVSALGRLLMNLSKNQSEKITLEEEIALLNDYIAIQNIRYKGKIKPEYCIDNEDLLKYKIVKFSLQPIVENAIFHGIEPKKEAGRIIIRIHEDGNSLIIQIEDDGVGMSDEQIQALLSAADQPKRGMSGIGVKNVRERLRLAYGPTCDLEIESVLGEYTRITFKIPKEYY